MEAVYIVGGVVFALLSVVAFLAGCYIASEDFQGNGITDPGEVSGFAFLEWFLSILAAGLSVVCFVAA